MFPEPIKKVLWKAVLAKGCFCFHKIKLPQPDGLSAISFNHHQWLRLTDMPSCEPASSVVAAKPRCDLCVNFPLNRSFSHGGRKDHKDQRINELNF